MSNLLKHAENELDLIGLTEDSSDAMNASMRKHILHMVEEFSKEGHSGFSASYAISILTKLLDFKPLSPLTGEDSEWNDISDYAPEPHYQNKRRSSVFKDADGSCYDIDGKVFWEWCAPYEGREPQEPYKSYYSCRDSRVDVIFPYMPPDEPIYEYRHSDAEPQQPPQTEQGFL
jgi:hypothetical protein